MNNKSTALSVVRSVDWFLKSVSISQDYQKPNKVELRLVCIDSFQLGPKFTFPRKPAPVLTRSPCSVATHKSWVTPGGQRSGAARQGEGSPAILLSESISSRRTWKRRIPVLWCDRPLQPLLGARFMNAVDRINAVRLIRGSWRWEPRREASWETEPLVRLVCFHLLSPALSQQKYVLRMFF